MTIDLDNVSKRYAEEWILRNVNYNFKSGTIYGIAGANGSGKSTMVKLISGHLSPSVGTLTYMDSNGVNIHRDEVYKKCTFWGPHVGLIPQLSVDEMIDYYFTFKSISNGLTRSDFVSLVDLPVKGHRFIKSLSSGQTQRLGLGLSILAKSDILLLDEPASFLDEPSLIWFHDLLKNHVSERLVIIASNDSSDFQVASQMLNIEDYR